MERTIQNIFTTGMTARRELANFTMMVMIMTHDKDDDNEILKTQ